MVLAARPDHQHPLHGVEQQLHAFRSGKPADAALVEGDALCGDADHGLVDPGEHVPADHLEGSGGFLLIDGLRLVRFLALQLVLDLLLCGGQIPGDLGNAVVIHQAPDPAARFR